VRALPPTFGDVLELHVTLRDINPPVWRALRVPAELSLAGLHEVLQIAFGWQNSHLHEFVVGDIPFGMHEAEDERLTVDERAAPLGAVARAGCELLYRYDFGDDWEHDVRIDRIDSGGVATICCIGGARTCPPEDCGGPPGYEHLLEVLADAKHEEHADMKQWAPRGFDAERFDLAAVNKKLAALSKRLARRQGK